MRKSGIVTLLVILGIFFTITFLLTDILFETLIEDFGSDAVGAEVEFDEFHFSLAGPEISWQRLQITDPKSTMKNMFETARCEFNMEFWPLLSGKFVIENFELSGLARNTPRETDGKIEKKKKALKKGDPNTAGAEADSSIAQTQTNLKKEKKSSSEFGLLSMTNVNTDSIIALLDIRTPHLIDSTQKAIQQNFEKWGEKLSSADPDADVSRIQKQINSINIKKIKSLNSFNDALSSTKNIQGSIDSLNKAYKDAKKDFNKDYDASGSTLGEIDNWISADYRRAISMAKLPDLSAQNIGKMLFGDQIVDQIYEYLGYVGTARGYLNKLSGNKKDDSPPRFKGQNIYFATPNARPDFWLKNMGISGFLTEELPLGGSITHVTTAPKMIGLPVKIEIKGSSPSRSYSLEGELNYLDSIPKETFSVNYKGLSLAGMDLSKSELFPTSIKNGFGIAEISFKMIGNTFDGKITFSGSNVSFAYSKEKPKGKMASIIRDVFNNTKELKITALIKGKPDNLIFAVKSNLDDELSKAFKTTANKEVEEAKAKIRKKIDAQVAGKKAHVEKLIKENKEKLQAQLEKYQSKIDEQTKLLSDKKKDIEKEKNNLGKKLKNLF